MMEEEIVRRRVAELFGLTEEQCDEIDRIMSEDIQSLSEDTNELIRQTIEKFAKNERERMAFFAGHITGWILMKTEIDVQSYFSPYGLEGHQDNT